MAHMSEDVNEAVRFSSLALKLAPGAWDSIYNWNILGLMVGGVDKKSVDAMYAQFPEVVMSIYLEAIKRKMDGSDVNDLVLKILKNDPTFVQAKDLLK